MPDKEKESKEHVKEVQRESEKPISKHSISDKAAGKILEMSEISLWLDDYDDIFSDFDPRPYSQRSLSDDFLSESKKASRDKDANKLELRLLIAEGKRDLKNETLIKKRLREHFNKHAHLLRKEIKETKRKSIIQVIAGGLMILGATYVNSIDSGNFLSRLLFVLLEPAGWFLTWFALEKMFYTTESMQSEYNFYEKMSKCDIIFSSY